jgi:antitoxin component of MazEF toxin-antitoxin module
MRKKLVKQGNSYGIIINQALLDLVGLTGDSREVEITTDGRSIMLTPVGPVLSSREKFEANAATAPLIAPAAPTRKKAAGV